jgi:hypothetical protein
MGKQSLGAQRPPVGVIAPSTALAASLARELHITNPITLSPKTIREGALRDVHVGVVLIDNSVWPLESIVMTGVLAGLARHLGSLLVVGRIDARRTDNGVSLTVAAK